MKIKGMPIALAMALSAAGCGEQAPAFKETTQYKRFGSDDAVARKDGRLEPLPGEADGVLGKPGSVGAKGNPDGIADAGGADGGIGVGADGGMDAGGNTGDLAYGGADGGGAGGADGGGAAGGNSAGGADAGGGNMAGGADGQLGEFPDGGGDAGGADGGADGGVTIPTGSGTGNGDAGGTDATGGTDGTGGTGGTGGTDAGGTDGTGVDGTDGGASDGGADAGCTTGCTDGTDGGADGTDGGTDGGGGTVRTVDVVQQGPGKVDILWVVDVSGSMAEEQNYLSQNFGSLINQLAASGHNFQTAITTTDVCQDTIPGPLVDRRCPVEYGGTAATHLRGSFVGTAGRKVLKQGEADLVTKFQSYVMQGTDGSGFEHGLYGAKMAIDKVIAGQNEALIRSDAFLSVIVVSDEQDDGIGMSETDAYNGHNFYAEGHTLFRWTDDDMIDYLKTAKGEGKFSISTITPVKLANGQLCSAPHTQPAEEGTQYIKAAQKSGGLVQSLCSTNWSASLGNIGLDLSAQITQVVLPSSPVVATIQVKVNGTVTTQWTYNAGNNAVKFNAGHVPAEGAQIHVNYTEM